MTREIIRLRDRPELLEKMAGWFQHTFGIPAEVYRESMKQCLGGGKVPQWYVWMEDGVILGGMGVIENDFHSRTDLAPNVCAVYVDEPYRGRGIAGKLLDFVCLDMAGMGIDTLYLITNHTSLYERYGWEFYCTADTEDGPGRIYRHVTPREISLCGDDCLVCPRRQARTREELRALAELWHRAGWRDSPPSPEEMECGGCTPDKACAYGLVRCAGEHGVKACAGCVEFPCGKLREVLEQSRAGQARCREVCTPEEYARLERAFFRKEENWEALC